MAASARRPPCRIQVQTPAPIGDFIVDFVCFEQKLATQADGGQHVELIAHDEVRTTWLQAQGSRVLRFWNHDVLQHRDLVLEEILRQLEKRELQ